MAVESENVRVRANVARLIGRLADQEHRTHGEVVERAVGCYLRWRAEQSYVDERPDLADPTTDGVIGPRVISVPMVLDV